MRERVKKPKFRLNLFILINYFPFIRVCSSANAEMGENQTRHSLLCVCFALPLSRVNFFSFHRKIFLNFLYYPNSRQFFKAIALSMQFPSASASHA